MGVRGFGVQRKNRGHLRREYDWQDEKSGLEGGILNVDRSDRAGADGATPECGLDQVVFVGVPDATTGLVFGDARLEEILLLLEENDLVQPAEGVVAHA
jgi:hypothetical protein